MRDVIVSDWLAKTEWARWRRMPVAGDASARRYERLEASGGHSVILMDAPPDTCGTQKPFVDIAMHLRALDLAAPEVLAWDEALGVMVISDLGQVDVAQHLRVHPAEESMIYSAAVEVLTRLRQARPPDGLTIMTPSVGVEMTDLAFEWAAQDGSVDLKTEIQERLRSLMVQVDHDPHVLSLRDFHAENLIWRGMRRGTDRVGLLDFQDAFVAHPTYDLASLIRDARRDVDPTMLPDLLTQLDPTADRDGLRLAFGVMAIQRNLRILGVFERLTKHEGKLRYLDFVARVQGHLHEDLKLADFADLRPLIDQAFLKGATP